MGKQWKQWQTLFFFFFGSQITADVDCSHEIKRHLLLGRTAMTNLDSILKKQNHYFANKGLSSQSYGFSSSHVWMWELDCKESWAPKNGCFWTVVLEKTLESLLDCKEIQPVHPKGNQSRIFTGRPDTEAATPILWPPDVKKWLIWKDPMLGKIKGERRRGQQRMRWLDGVTDSTQWTWVWVNSGCWWWTGRPGVLQSLGSQRVRHDWMPELNWTELIWSCMHPYNGYNHFRVLHTEWASLLC